MFDCARVTVRATFSTLDVTRDLELLYPNTDEKGAILKNDSALDDAYAAGQSLVAAANRISPPPGLS